MTPSLLPPDELQRRSRKVRRAWEKRARGYDASMRLFERRVLGEEHRAWVCGRARGATLEVAVGTGLNLAHYPDAVQLIGLDLSRAMLEVAAARAAELGRSVALIEGDAQALPFADAVFDSVVCTYSLCAVPDLARTVTEMRRVLRPGGVLLLLDHVESSVRPLRWAQRALEVVTVPLEGEHFTRRPLKQVVAAGLHVRERERFRAGIVERLAAAKAGPRDVRLAPRRSTGARSTRGAKIRSGGEQS